MRALTLVIFLISFQVEADSFENSNWKVKSYRISGEEAAWSTEEAEAVNGKSVSFMKNQFKLGGQSCKVKITSATDDKRWTTGEQNPCTGEKLRGNVYILSYENCEARFPGQVALPQPGQAVAFGEGISFCLHKK